MTEALIAVNDALASTDKLIRWHGEGLKLAVALAFAMLSKSGPVVKDHGIPVSWVGNELAVQYPIELACSEVVRIVVGSGLSVAGVRERFPSYSLALQMIDGGVIEPSQDKRYLKWRPLTSEERPHTYMHRNI